MLVQHGPLHCHGIEALLVCDAVRYLRYACWSVAAAIWQKIMPQFPIARLCMWQATCAKAMPHHCANSTCANSIAPMCSWLNTAVCSTCRDGYAPIMAALAAYGARASFTCVEMRDCEHPPEGRCSPQGLLQQVSTCRMDGVGLLM
jgi:hypothetical protein